LASQAITKTLSSRKGKRQCQDTEIISQKINGKHFGAEIGKNYIFWGRGKVFEKKKEKRI
jgi:hypothetical protein